MSSKLRYIVYHRHHAHTDDVATELDLGLVFLTDPIRPITAYYRKILQNFHIFAATLAVHTPSRNTSMI